MVAEIDKKMFTFLPMHHRGHDVILIKYPYGNRDYANYIKKHTNGTFTITHRGYWVLDNDHYRKLFRLPAKNVLDKMPEQIAECNQAEWVRYIKLLQQKAYSPSTIKTYNNEFTIFLKTIKDTPVVSLENGRLNDYFHYCISKLKLSENQVHSRINAIKFYYEQVLGRCKLEVQIIRPKKEKQLPRVMSFEDVQALLNTVKNNKHYFILALTYGTGMRLSEIVNLKLRDIDVNRKTLFISHAKGKKDRVVGFPKSLLHFFELYKLEYKPKEYLFEGQYGGQYSVKSVQEVFQKAKQLAKIDNVKGIHSFRHSYATHLHEMGTDISSIQKLLGHNDVKTTMIYTHISKREMESIISPLDQLIRQKSAVNK
jgi:integrase/recombinase XerD